jgi:ribosomal protein S15P/S13E
MAKLEMEKPAWLKVSEEEIKKAIAELAGKYQPAQIGLILRDQYGLPSTRIFGKKLSVYLKELGIDTSGVELQNVEKKVENIKEHLKKHEQDKKARHKIQKPQSRVSRIKRYLEKKAK